MGRMKNWMMEMEDAVVDGLHAGAKTENDVVAYCKTNMIQPVDENFVRKFYAEINGEPFFPPEVDNWGNREGPCDSEVL